MEYNLEKKMESLSDKVDLLSKNADYVSKSPLNIWYGLPAGLLQLACDEASIGRGFPGIVE